MLRSDWFAREILISKRALRALMKFPILNL